jgi:hypothetical protein
MHVDGDPPNNSTTWPSYSTSISPRCSFNKSISQKSKIVRRKRGRWRRKRRKDNYR